MYHNIKLYSLQFLALDMQDIELWGHRPAVLANLHFLGLDKVDWFQHELSSRISARSLACLLFAERPRVASSFGITCVELLRAPTFPL